MIFTTEITSLYYNNTVSMYVCVITRKQKRTKNKPNSDREARRGSRFTNAFTFTFLSVVHDKRVDKVPEEP